MAVRKNVLIDELGQFEHVALQGTSLVLGKVTECVRQPLLILLRGDFGFERDRWGKG